MEKVYKPVPDVEAIRYKGTPEKPDIKIFVSHRIDLDAEVIDNPLYVPVRCGAVYDERENVTMLGDDTGDNISEKRMSFCELTVQYWAWKNVKADYYGLCHYRRYLGFSDEKYPVDKLEANNGCVVESSLSQKSVEKHCLTEKKMRAIIEDYDVIAMEPIKLNGTTNYGAMANSPDYHNMDDVDIAIDIIEKKYPHMIPAVEKYMRRSENCWLYNCWIMKADIFEEYSQWLFSVLEEVEKKIDNTYYNIQMCRTPGTLGERLFGIYMTYLQQIQRKRKLKINYQQLLFFKSVERENDIKPFRNINNIAIASNFNNTYAPIFSVLLQSIMDHSSKENNYDCIVLGRDISDTNKKLLLSVVAQKDNFSIRFINPEPFLNGIDMYVANAVYTDDMYTRVLIPHILPTYDKVLVLDADMICTTDIADLFNEDLTGYWAGAVKDVIYAGYLNGVVPGTLEYAQKTLRLAEPYNYCNTGTILFNCQLYREEYSLEYLQNYIHTHQYRIYEQDTLNVLIHGHMKFFDRRWNMYTYTNDFIEKCAKFAPIKDYQDYLKARKNPYIIHYAAHPKPWWSAAGDYATFFWQSARKTPFYEEILAMMAKYIANNSVAVNNPPQLSTNITDNRTGARRLADEILPKGTRRRELAKKILPKGSLRWRFCKQIYYLFAPQHRPKK